MTSLSQLVHQFVSDLPEVQRVVLAVSGGVDSMVLLHSAQVAQLPQPLLVLHVNHQLSPRAPQWQALVADTCARSGIECRALVVEVNVAGSGLEEAARQARYQTIENQLRPGDLVLMAHHRQDQLETFFLRLARGAGVRGLAGIAPLRAWGPARLGRPFLTLDRSTIEDYARSHGLVWVDDESNASDRFDRNFLRLNVLPALQQRWPDLPAQVSQATEHLRESDDLLREFAAMDLAQCQPRDERIGISLDMGPLLSWPRSRRNNLLRHWLTVLGYRLPARKRLDEVDALLMAGQDQNPLLNWGDCELRRYRQRIYCLPAHWQTSAELTGGTITWKSQSPGLAPGSYSVVTRAQAPDVVRAHPSERAHSQTLKKLLQEYALEPWLREYVPLILDNDRLVAVGDLWIEKGAAVAAGVVPVWSFSLPGMARV
jgi:tRNA(Ile)-lysidine synthetase, N-terminal domain/tRNA(Ile)-lysidine synthetase, C-terminal domain